MATLAATFDPADKSAPGHYGPSHTALLLLDLHSSFVDRVGGASGGAVLQTAAQMRSWAKSHGIVVVHALIDADAAPFATCKGAERLTGLAAALKSDGGREPAELVQGGDEGDVTFTRTPGHVSALKSPGLDGFLRAKGITSLVLAGLSTSGCVARTAFAANDAEYVVTVISDGCADPTEGVHDMMVGKLLNNRGYVTTAAKFREGFAKAMGQG